MNQTRQPKGTPTGGQFAPGARPESSNALDEPDTPSTSHLRVLTPGYRSLHSQFDMTFDPGDPWGSAMAWRFAVADALYHTGSDIPDAWAYRHGPICQGDDDDFTSELVRETLAEGEVGSDDLRAFGDALDRYSRQLSRAGRDY